MTSFLVPLSGNLLAPLPLGSGFVHGFEVSSTYTTVLKTTHQLVATQQHQTKATIDVGRRTNPISYCKSILVTVSSLYVSGNIQITNAWLKSPLVTIHVTPATKKTNSKTAMTPAKLELAETRGELASERQLGWPNGKGVRPVIEDRGFDSRPRKSDRFA